MEECIQDMSDEEPFAADSEDDPEYVQESESSDSELGQQIPRKKQKCDIRQAVPSTSKKVRSSSSDLSYLSGTVDIDETFDVVGWGPTERKFKDFTFDVPFGVPVDIKNEL